MDLNGSGNYQSTLMMAAIHKCSGGMSGRSNWLSDGELNKGELEYFNWFLTFCSWLHNPVQSLIVTSQLRFGQIPRMMKRLLYSEWVISTIAKDDSKILLSVKRLYSFHVYHPNYSSFFCAQNSNLKSTSPHHTTFMRAAMDYVPIQWNRTQLVNSYATTPLLEIADTFERIAKVVDARKSGDTKELRLDAFCNACSSLSVLFGSLGIAFKFADFEYASKVRDLTEASNRYVTLQQIIDSDLANGMVRKQGSHTRNLRRVRQGIELVKALFQNFLSSEDQSLKEAATGAYAQACAPFHSWAVRTAVYAGIYALPSRDQLLLKLNETDESAEKKMRRFINAAVPIIEYIDKIYTSRNIRLDW